MPRETNLSASNRPHPFHAVANRLIFYLHGRLIAAKHGWGLGGPQSLQRHAEPEITGPVLDARFPNAVSLFPRNAERMHEAGEQPIACTADQFKQDYRYLRQSRDAARCILRVTDPHAPAAIGPNDETVVIHFRDVEKEFMGSRFADIARGHTIYEYFAAALSALPPPPPHLRRRIWIMTEPDSEFAPIPQRLANDFGAQFYRGDDISSHAMGRAADIFIGSFGTFSWIIAYLTCATRIVLPYFSDIYVGASWLPWHMLFIDDDERLRYIDCKDQQNPASLRFETPREVVTRNDSAFARAILDRDSLEAASPCYGATSLCPLRPP